MRITSLVLALVAAGALAAFGQEGTGQEIKEGAKKAGEKIKQGAETVGEKTKEAAKTVGEKTKETAETVTKKTKETVEGKAQVRKRKRLPVQPTENPERHRRGLKCKPPRSNPQIRSPIRLHRPPAVAECAQATALSNSESSRRCKAPPLRFGLAQARWVGPIWRG